MRRTIKTQINRMMNRYSVTKVRKCRKTQRISGRIGKKSVREGKLRRKRDKSSRSR